MKGEDIGKHRSRAEQKLGPGAAKMLPSYEEEGAVLPELRVRSLRQGMASSQGDRKSTRLNSSHSGQSRMPSSA